VHGLAQAHGLTPRTGGYPERVTAAGAIFLIAVGAILRYATNVHVEGVSLDTVGLILMIAGIAGLIIGLWQWATLSRRTREGDVLVEERRGVRERPPY
jgi:uncharacterized membrane protein YidH (DUF202 family)